MTRSQGGLYFVHQPDTLTKGLSRYYFEFEEMYLGSRNVLVRRTEGETEVVGDQRGNVIRLVWSPGNVIEKGDGPSDRGL